VIALEKKWTYLVQLQHLKDVLTSLAASSSGFKIPYILDLVPFLANLLFNHSTKSLLMTLKSSSFKIGFCSDQCHDWRLGRICTSW
jgi:hypothetical protein